MRITLIALVVALALSACTGDSGGAEGVSSPAAPSTTESADSGATSTTAALTVPPQLADHDIDLVPVGDRLLLLAIVDSPGLREQGLMHVEDLGDLDGMLFTWSREASGTFWMKNTVIPLDIVWFDESGRFVGRASMVPCETETCPKYRPPGNPEFRFAIEANPGDLDWIDESTVIAYDG